MTKYGKSKFLRRRRRPDRRIEDVKQPQRSSDDLKDRLSKLSTREITEHRRFYDTLSKWGPDVPSQYAYVDATDQAMEEARKREITEHRQKQKNEKKLNKKTASNLKKFDKNKKAQTTFAQAIINNSSDPVFNQAIDTQRTKTGVRVGGYLIKINNGAPQNDERSYDVINLKTQKTIIKNLKLYEIAFCIVTKLYGDPNTRERDIEFFLQKHAVYLSKMQDIRSAKSKLATARATDNEQDIGFLENRLDDHTDKLGQIRADIHHYFDDINNKWGGPLNRI